MNWKFAKDMADILVAALDGVVEKVEIAGSIRRHRTKVNDIDLVLLPKDGAGFISRKTVTVMEEEGDTGKEGTVYHFAGVDFLPIRGGKHYITMLSADHQIKVDVWIAKPKEPDDLLGNPHPSNWGSLLLCRTGSKDHNQFIARRARSMGLKWNIKEGLVDGDGKIVAAATEKEIFKALKLDYIEPYDRER